MKVARCAAIAGAAGTANVAAAMRYGLDAVGTMAHSYVMSFDSEVESFCAFMEDTPENAVMLVDPYDTLEGVRNAIAASEATGVELKGVRLDSGDLLALSHGARDLLDRAGMTDARIVASGDLEEGQIAGLVAAGAPIDVWGVGTDLGTSRDSPALGGVYKLLADMPHPGGWRPVVKRSPAKATVPAPKQVFRSYRNHEMTGDLIAAVDEQPGGSPLLHPVMQRERQGCGELTGLELHSAEARAERRDREHCRTHRRRGGHSPDEDRVASGAHEGPLASDSEHVGKLGEQQRCEAQTDHSQPPPDDAPVLHVDAVAVFGGVNIKHEK